MFSGVSCWEAGEWGSFNNYSRTLTTNIMKHTSESYMSKITQHNFDGGLFQKYEYSLIWEYFLSVIYHG